LGDDFSGFLSGFVPAFPLAEDSECGDTFAYRGIDGFFSLRDGIALGDFPENRFSLFFQDFRFSELVG